MAARVGQTVTAALVLSLGLKTSNSWAADAAAEQAESTTPKPTSLETIIVTAQKRAQEAQDVPVPLTRARDRFGDMDVNRHTWRSMSSSLLGAEQDEVNLLADAKTFVALDYSEAAYQAMFNRLRNDYGRWDGRCNATSATTSVALTHLFATP